MKADNLGRVRAGRIWLDADQCDIEAFANLIAQRTEPAEYPFAATIINNIPVYDGASVRAAAADPDTRRVLLAEWAEALMDGPGVVALRGAFADHAVVDAATAHFEAMIAAQKAEGSGAGDHFAKPGANDRIWNALEKLCLRDAETFAAYYGNEIIALIAEAWLGPWYQVTSQINQVNPGGAAQSAHRDYHLGFQSAEAIARYPAHVHRLSPVLTLQGGIAHCDMPLESGPTLFLPYSQRYLHGYFATAQKEFREYFKDHCVQLPLGKGDAVFFNPALFHAAGANRTADIKRLANLLQISSAYGRAMESVDRTRMSVALYPALRRMLAEGRISKAEVRFAIAASAEGYPFPTNLDRDPPIGGLAPESQQELLSRALADDWETESFISALETMEAKKHA